MDSDPFERVRLLKVRRNQILQKLPEADRRELEEIDATVQAIDRAVAQHGYRPQRVPLSQRRQVLRDFLAAHQPATRADILAGTNIPAGTLSALLAEPEFSSSSHGLWGLTPPPTECGLGDE